MPDSPPAVGSQAWLDAILKGRLGPAATTGEIVFEGRTLRIAGAQLPLGPLRLDVERAELELGAGLPLGELPLSLRLVTLRAVLRAGDVAVSLDLTAIERTAPSWFSGIVRAHGASAAALDGSLEVNARGFSLATAAGTRLTFALDAAGDLEGSRLTGRLVLGDVLALGLPAPDLAPRPETVLDLDLTARGSLADPALHGRVFSPTILLGHRARPDAPPLRLDAVRASLDVDRHGLRYQELRGDAHGARFAGWGCLPFAAASGEAAPLAALAIEGAGIALVRALSSLSGTQVRVPDDLSVSGELMLKPNLAASGAFAVETPRTKLLLQLVHAPGGSLVGSTLRGRLAAADAITLGLFEGPVRPRPPALLDVDARLTGSVGRPGITGFVGCVHCVLDISADAAPSFVLDDVSVLLDVDPERIAWHRFRGRFYGGTFLSSGGAGRSSGLHATLAWGGVRVELVPTHASGDSRLTTLLHGAASGEIHFERHEGTALAARGQVALAEPRYFFTRALRAELDRYGLPRVRARGRGPLSARVQLERGVLRVESLSAAVEGIEVAGDVQLGLDGSLAGRVLVHLLEGYLAESAVLAIPAAIADRVTVPINLGGTVRAPEVRTDTMEILGGVLSQSRLGEALKSVIDGLRKKRR